MAADTISFARGAPSLDIVDVEGLKAAAKRAFENDPAGLTGYGTAIGYPPLRQWIADQHQVEPQNVIVTNGSMQADAFLFDQLVAPGDPVVVERPTYDRTLLGLRQRGADIRPIELEPDGIDVEGVGRLISDGIRPKLAHVIPNFQNPAGVTTSRAKRERLVALAAEHGFLLIEDDPYREVRFAGTDEPTMLSMDRGEHVLYATSMTKTVAPGVRVGALVLPQKMWPAIRQLANDTFIAPGHLAQVTVAEYCAAGAYEPGLERVRARLRERRDAMVAALDRTLGKRVTYITPEGGYFLWIRLAGVDADKLAADAERAGVGVVKGSSFYPDGRGRDELRLAFSAVTPEEITEGVERLAALVP